MSGIDIHDGYLMYANYAPPQKWSPMEIAKIAEWANNKKRYRELEDELNASLGRAEVRVVLLLQEFREDMNALMDFLGAEFKDEPSRRIVVKKEKK